MSADVRDVNSIEFGVLSAEDIKNMALCKVDSTKLTGPNTVYDDRMGVTGDNTEKCVTCGLKSGCWGHFGYIELHEPVLHPMYYKMIAVFLRCFCKQCHRLLLLPDQIEIAGLNRGRGERRFQKLLDKLERTDICSHCNSPQPKIVYKSKEMTISMEYKQKRGEKVAVQLNVDEIKKIFDNVQDDDVRMLGMDPKLIHPRNLILTVLPVIPPCSRPYVKSDGNICDDDLTYQLIEIVKTNNQILKNSESEDKNSEQKRQKPIQSLRFRTQTLCNNSKGKAKHPTDSRPLKGLKERLAGKGGRLRSNLMGKRTNYSARTVIGAEPTLKLNQVGIPYEVARIHTKPETVTSYNIDWLTEIVNTGRANIVLTKVIENGEEKVRRFNLQYYLAEQKVPLLKGDVVIRGSGEPKKDRQGRAIVPKNDQTLRSIPVGDDPVELLAGDRIIRQGKIIPAFYRRKMQLKIGDIVERQLQAGDIVLFNRQPTLHRGSMLALEVVPLPFKTFRFNLAGTKSFNADFDQLVENREHEKCATP